MALSGLALWISDRYSTIGDQLNFSETTYNNIVVDALETLDISSESEADAIVLHAVGVYQFWKKCLIDVSLDVNFTADGSSFSRSDLHKQIMVNLVSAEREAFPYLPIADATVESIVGTDPYGYFEARDGL